jgi:hypothetical protein
VETFGDLLEMRKGTIVERWVDAALSSYPSESAALFRQQQDPFANPLGHSVREGIRGVFDSIRDGTDPEELRARLDQIVRPRAVQQLTPAEALSFVFSLRSIVREVIPESGEDPRLRKGLDELDERIDTVALAAFDVYAARREEVGQLRINEVKRQVAWVLKKLNRQGEGNDDVLKDSKLKASTYNNVQREDLR